MRHSIAKYTSFDFVNFAVLFRKLESTFTQQEKELLVYKREQSNLLIKVEELSEINSKSNSEISSLKHSSLSTELTTENAIKTAEDSFHQKTRQALADQDTAFMVSCLILI